MKVRGRDAMRDARNARSRGRRNTRGGDRGRLFSYLLKRRQEYAARRAFPNSPGLECTQVRRGGQNMPSQVAPAQTITFLPVCTGRSAASSASMCLFENMPTEVLLNNVFPHLDFMSLIHLLYSCKSFRNLEVMNHEARSFIIRTTLQKIIILDACILDLVMILDPEIIGAWMEENDGSEFLDSNYFDFYQQNFYSQAAGELGDHVQDDNPQTFCDEKLKWFTHEIDSELNTIRNEVLESFRERHNPPADHLKIQTQQVYDELNRRKYASLTCSETDGSSFSVSDQLRHEVERRRANAVDLHHRLQDVNKTTLCHIILHKLSKGDQKCVEEYIEEWIGRHRDGMTKEEPPTVSTGAPTRNASERVKPSGAAEREENVRAWALDILQKLDETWEVIRRKQHAEEIASETSLLKELYRALIWPVEGALEGAEELLIVPHKELFEVPWAALTDADGRYLIERHVIRTAPSLRVARQAAEKMQTSGMQTYGHVVLVGNPLPIPQQFRPLIFANKEVDSIYEILNNAGLEVLPKHHFRENLGPPATKANVKNSLQDAAWAHMALHGDLETKSLVLAIPFGTDQDTDSGLSMREVQGSEQEQVQGRVQMAPGATVVLSACNTGLGDIKAEGVVGLARGFLLANASAAVVSLWSVDDGSTAALMRIKYEHLAEGCTVPQALRLAMLRLARRPDRLAVPHKEYRAPEVCESREVRKKGRQAAGDGDGARGSSGGGSGGVLPDLQPWFEMLGGGTEGASRCPTRPSPAAHPTTHSQKETEDEQKWQNWLEFCKRVRQKEIVVTCVLDFPYSDAKRLKLVGDDKLLERLYCYKDLNDDSRRMILKVHTLRKWGERGDELYQRASKVTAVKFLYADPSTNPYVQQYDHGKPSGMVFKVKFEIDTESELNVLPVSGLLREKWRTFRENGSNDFEWEWSKSDSMPSAEGCIECKRDGFSMTSACNECKRDGRRGKVKSVYDDVRAAIQLGQGLFHRGATVTSMQGYGNPYGYGTPFKEVKGKIQTNSMLRNSGKITLNGSEVEYDAFYEEAFPAEDVTDDGLKEEWERPMHWAAFLVVGAATRMPRGTPSQPEAAETVGSEAEAKRKQAGSTSDLAP